MLAGLHVGHKWTRGGDTTRVGFWPIVSRPSSHREVVLNSRPESSMESRVGPHMAGIACHGL